MPPKSGLASSADTAMLNALHIFNPEHLESNEDINAAIEVLEGTIDPSNIAVIVAHAMERPFALEFIVSVISQDTFAFLSQWIVAHFPTTLDDYTAKPVSVKALIRLHLSLFSLQLSDAHESDSLWEYMRAVELAQPVLCALSDIVKGTDFLSDTTTSNRKSARRTMSKAASQSKVMVDIKPFRDLDIQVPSNAAAALELAVNILSNQKKILEYFLDVFRRPSLFDTLKDMYMNPPINVPSVPSRQTDIPVVLNSPLVETPIDVPHKSAGQILKATLYHQSADGFGEWRIFLGDKAAKDLRQLRKGDANMLKIVVNKLRELSNGRFSETNQKKITGSQVPLPIFEAKLPGDNRIVYQIDFVQEYEAQFGHQVLNIYGIENHAYISRQFWDKFARTKAHIKGSDYSDLCKLRDHPRHTGDDVFSPMTIPAPLKEELGGEVPLEIANISTKDLADFHSLLVLDKYVAVSQNVLTGLLLDQEHDEEIAHIFRVSPREQEIIEHTGSCYVLGRSGTGKTTTMLFKIFGIERAWIQSGCTDPRPRQIFVTKSRVLAEKVEEYFQRFVRSLAQESEAPHVNDILRRSTLRGERGMVNVEEDIAWRDDLPEKYSELVNSHFPLFITFDNLATMVEADMQNTASSPSHGRKKNSVSADSDNPLLMSYEIFRDEYWPRFPYHVQNGFAPSLVFGEFIGVIKGSQMTLGHKNRVLDRNAYNNLSPRTQPMFADKRNVLYDLFELYKVENRRRDELYMKRKVKNRYRDAADRTHTLLDAIRDHEFPGEKVDFIYVDEVQDLLLIDTLFLRWICKNPNGLFWAGDTAQTISFGSAFRFDDLTSFLHDVEKQSESNIVQGRSTTRKPEFFQLLTNYRSHAGIVNCAHSIIDLIKEFWYDSIDILGRERGIVDGMRPIFVDGWDETQFKLFFAENKDRSVRELGEHQCILVRDDTAREKLEELIGDVGIILTLYESKGLEFDDVLLYNFFEDSAVDENQWRRVIKAAQEGPHAWSYRSAVGTSAPSVGIELKFLYVAVTRTRKKLLFVDQSSIAGPIKQYWVNKGLIDVQSPEDTLSDFASASKPEEWVERARTLFARHQYDQATKAFRRANLPREATIANAYQLRVLAQRDTKTSVQSFCRAADAFNECASDSSNEKEIKSFFEIAGDCYLESKKYPQAAKAYENARLFTQAISCYLAARLLDEAVSILKIHEETIESGVAERVRNIARCAYLNAQKHKQAMEFFQNEDEMAQFMEDLGFDHAHAVFLERKGDIKASAELYRKEGDTLHAIELLLKDGNHVKQTLEYLLRALWKHLSFGVRYVPTQDQTPSSLELRELFSFLDRLPQDEMSTQEIAEVNMFKAIRDSDMQTLERLAGVLCQSDVVEPAAVLCLHHFFSQQSSLAMGTQEETIVTLQMFQNYVRLMREIIMLPNPVDSEVVQKLFAIQPGSVQGQVVIPMGTFIWKHFDETTPHVSQTQDMHIPPGLFMQEFRQGLIERLRILVESENDSCFRSTVFNPCSKIIVGGRCFRTDCSYAHELDEAWYTRRVRFHLQQICILHIFQSLYTDSFPHRIRLQRFWINRLQDMFHPLSYNCGSASTICIDDIQEARLAFHCINQWVTGILFTLEPNLETLQRPFLTNFLNASAVGYIVNGKTIDDCLDRIPCIHSPLERHPLLLTNGGSSYILFKLRAFMKGHGDGLYKGALFFSYVIEHRVPVHIGAMCHLLDRTCGLFSLRYNYQYKKTLHGITLPRTWLLEHWEDFGGKYGDKASRAYRSVVSPIAQLIEDIYLWDYSDPDLYRKPFDIPRHVAKSICLSRICKAVCLLGYNINDLVLRQDIVRALSSLRAKYPTDVFDAVYAPYVMAKNWDDLARIIRVSMMNSPFDEMVQLISARSIQPTNALRGIRRVVFEKHDDIPLLLDPLPYTRLPTFMKVRTQASSFSSKRTQASSSSNNDSDLEATVSTSSETVTPLVAQTVAQTDEDAENSADADEADEVATSASEESDIMDHVDTGTSEEQLEAVKRVQQIFRRTLKRRNAAAKGGFAASQARFFDACLDQVRAVNWAPRLPYRIVYLGLLPHILLCLEWLKNSATELREGIKKKRTLELSMDELEKSLEDMIMAKNILDRVERLLEMLEPKSSFHDERDLDQFRHFAEEVKGLMNDLSGSKRVPKEDIELVMKGLSPAKTQRIRPKRPELNVEDLDM